MTRDLKLVFGLVDDFLDPGHHAPQPLSGLLDRVGGIEPAARRHLGVVRHPFENEPLGIIAILDIGQALLHCCTALVVDYLRSGDIFAIFSVVGDGVVHVGNATLVHQVNNQLEFMQALEIGHFGGVAGFNQGLESGLHQLHCTAAEYGLLTEKVGLGLVFE